MKRLLTICLGLMLCVGLGAQTLGEYKVLDKGRSNKRIKKKKKRVYIADFQVNYQLGLALQDEKKGGRMFGGGVKGDTKATLVLGIAGVDVDPLQELTDKLSAIYKRPGGQGL